MIRANQLNPELSHRKNGKMLVRCVPSKHGHVMFFMRCGNIWVKESYTGQIQKFKNCGEPIYFSRFITIIGKKTA